MPGVTGMKSTKQFQLPSWSYCFIGKIDLRSALGVRVVRRMEALALDVTNGDTDQLSYRQWSMINRAAWLEERISMDEARIAAGEAVSPGSLATLDNSLTGIFRTIDSIGPKKKRVVTLKEYVSQQDSS